LLYLLLLSTAVANITVVLSASKVASPLRSYLYDHWSWGHRLVTCPYCMAHWISAVLLLFMPNLLPELPWATGYFLSIMIIPVPSAAISLGLMTVLRSIKS